MFSCEFYKISKITFFIEHLWATASVSTTMIEGLNYGYETDFDESLPCGYGSNKLNLSFIPVCLEIHAQKI